MKMRAFLFSGRAGALGLGALVMAVWGCSGPEPLELEGDGGAGGRRGSGGAREESPRGSGACQDMEDEPDGGAVDSNCDGIDGDKKRAIFVSPSGDDTLDGSFEAPVRTLGVAIELAHARKLDVYACSATYEENVVLSDRKVRLFGGFSCEDGWKRTSEPVEVAPSSGLPLRVLDVITNGDDPLLVENFRFVAPDASEQGASSVTASIVRSSKVRFSRVEFVSGRGADAEEVEEAPRHTRSASPGVDGADAPNQNDLVGVYCSTPDPREPDCSSGVCVPYPDIWREWCRRLAEDTIVSWRCSGPSCAPTLCDADDGPIEVRLLAGGSGGNGFRDPEVPPTPGERDSGVPGAPGADGAHGEPDSRGFGSVTSDGTYVASNGGSRGKFGQIGENGGGGAGAPASFVDRGVFVRQLGGSGGSGGKAGCGGYPGNGGRAGGASIGVIVVDSDVELERVMVRTGDGGRGGAPTAGTPGQRGGVGGRGGASSYMRDTRPHNFGEHGGPGGDGGHGGSGGPGGGGPSVGIVVVGSAPSLKALSFELGRGGPGGEPLVDTLEEGASGVTRDVYVVPSSEE